MAALARKVVKVTVLTAGAIPLIGLAGTVSASSNDEYGEAKRHLVRACDLPVYELATTKKSAEEENVEVYEPDAFEKQISSVRKTVMEYGKSFQSSFNVVKTQVETGVDHSKMTLNYVQTNPGELPRVCFISVATMGGFVLGYRGGILRKVIYAGIAAASSAALCYPNYTVELTSSLAEDAKGLWKDKIGWPFDDTPSGGQEATTEKVKKPPKEVKGDPGQSNAEDTDMYSTRS